MEYPLQSDTESRLLALAILCLFGAFFFPCLAAKQIVGPAVGLAPAPLLGLLSYLTFRKLRSFDDVLRMDDSTLSVVRKRGGSAEVLESWPRSSIQELAVGVVPESTGLRYSKPVYQVKLLLDNGKLLSIDTGSEEAGLALADELTKTTQARHRKELDGDQLIARAEGSGYTLDRRGADSSIGSILVALALIVGVLFLITHLM